MSVNTFDKNLLDKILNNYNPNNPEELIGKDGLLSSLKKALIERALNTEMDLHLGYKKNGKSISNNYRNGNTEKSVITDDDRINIEVPRDRDSSFEPQIVKKGQKRFTGFDDKIISMYARGMTVREIQAHIEEIYGVDISHEMISNITDSIIDEIVQWQNRPLDKVYPIVFLDAIVIKCRDNGRVVNKSVYLALGVNMSGHKDILGFWIGQTEGAKFWLSIVTELKNRGLEDVFIFCVDGLKGFPEAINSVYPMSKIQLCIVHLIRNSLKFVPYKDRKAVASDLKKVYTAINEEEALKELANFDDKCSVVHLLTPD